MIITKNCLALLSFAINVSYKQHEASPEKKYSFLARVFSNAESMTAGRAGHVSEIENGPLSPPSLPLDILQYSLLINTCNKKTSTLTLPVFILLHRRRGWLAYPSLKKCSSPLITVMVSNLVILQASLVGSTGVAVVVVVGSVGLSVSSRSG